MKITGASIFLIIISGLIIYGNSINGAFISDDYSLVKNNAHIKNWAHIPAIFNKDTAAGGVEKYGFYRPLTLVTYMADYSLWRLDARGYHLTNIFTHILAAVVIYWLIKIIFMNNALSLLTGILFIIHPVHTEAVAYISGRADSLAVLFMLLCFVFYAKYLDSKNKWAYILLSASYALAVLSKENSLIIPALLLLYHYTFKKKINIIALMPVLIIASVYIMLRTVFLKSALLNVSSANTAFQRVPGFFAAIPEYIRLLIFPFGLHMDYGTKLFHFTDLRTVLGIVLVLFLLMYAVKTRRSNRLVFFSISWFFLALLPVSNIYPLFSYMAEHFLYLPSIGFFLLLANELCRLARTKGFRVSAAIFIVSLSAFYSFLTIMQNGYWKDPIDSYERTLKYNPHSTMAISNLALSYEGMGRKEEAVKLLKKVIDIDPNCAKAYNNLGETYYNMGRTEEAVRLYKKAIEIEPRIEKAYNNLGDAYYDMGGKEEAAQLYKKAIELDPNQAGTYHSLAGIYHETGRTSEAIELYKKAIEINPSFAEAYNNLGAAYYDMGRKEEAMRLYKKAIEIDPGRAETYNNLATTYYNMSKKEEAVELLKKAIEMSPNYVETYNNLGAAYYDMGRKEEAIELFKQAIEIDPNYAKAYHNLRKVMQVNVKSGQK